MQTRAIGSLEVSVAGLGCNNFGRRIDREQTAAVVHAALDAGITLFDTADIYGGGASEEFLGAALGARRDDAIVATKFGMRMNDDHTRDGASPRWLARAVEDSLRRLGTDRIDLYQLHRPDDATPIEETLDALDGLVRAGKVRELGNSNFNGAQVQDADDAAIAKGWARFACAQNRWNLLERSVEADTIPACNARGLLVLPYFPLEMGLLTGKYHRGEPPPTGTRLAGLPDDFRAQEMSDAHFETIEALQAFATERGHTLLELALSWLASQPVVASVIAGATTPEQVRANAAAIDWTLSPQDLQEIDRITAT